LQALGDVDFGITGVVVKFNHGSLFFENMTKPGMVVLSLGIAAINQHTWLSLWKNIICNQSLPSAGSIANMEFEI